ncbi:molybdopterin molybdotransferase MoeA [Undibacterium umbellatum]|uniref:Molybdopterin molybdenumtransferase n=1 Tax=Undibacterium umbellatum TaxID=2762300 RepID=A0ABR6Z518_9BURK|nr:gephyrin-like molybdotransferase Glp [Undibacterium umbellatum]MBC3906421.1 molybdopterin molybdenumtransferase MoeA [Undibacterium umbellatum]
MNTPPAPARNLHDITGCMTNYDPEDVSVQQAQDIMRKYIQPVCGMEKLTLRQALGRVLAVDITSPIDVPAHDNSAMDGYALRSEDLSGDQELYLDTIGTALAGVAFMGVVKHNQCVRIMTGAVLPEGCDTVVPQEFTSKVSDTQVKLSAGILRAGDNRRLKGEDLAKGRVALQKGKILTPADLGLLASLGIPEVSVQRRLRVAIFSTGDELRSLGEALEAGCVYDSNRYTLYGMLTRLGCDVLDMGVVQDNPDALEAAMRSACENADAIITSGGVSVGDADHTQQMMKRLGDVAFWSIAMRPGRPMAFGKIKSAEKSAYLFGLPGNPVAVMVSFYFFARQALLQLMGGSITTLPLLSAKSNTTIRKRPGRTEYQRGIFALDENGELCVSITGSQGSGILRSMSEANCMIVLNHDQASIAAGDKVNILLFDGLI